jgi:hypothetical protein
MPDSTESKLQAEGVLQKSAKIVGPERIQIEFLIEDLAKQLIIDRKNLVANGCNGCNSCS